MNFQDVILTLDKFWARKGCVVVQPYDLEVGAGTFHHHTTLKALGPEPWNVAYVQPSRRPTDGRYGDNPNRLQHYYQYQVILKPSPFNVQDLYLKSLQALGIDPLDHDIRFVEDDWESPTLGAAGLGWEIWLDGMEITQFTYFQQVGGLDCRPVTGEITYGLERIAMYLQGKNSIYDLTWTDGDSLGTGTGKVTYGDVFHQNEVEQSAYNFEHANVDELFKQFDLCEKESQKLPAGKYRSHYHCHYQHLCDLPIDVRFGTRFLAVGAAADFSLVAGAGGRYFSFTHRYTSSCDLVDRKDKTDAPAYIMAGDNNDKAGKEMREMIDAYKLIILQ